MALIIRRTFITDPNVPYAGKVLPKDRVPIKIPVTDPDVPYAGAVLPRDKVIPVPFSDPSNTPGFINLGGIILPPDTVITPIEGKKLLVQTVILDGPSVFERVTRHPTKIEIECILRMQNQGGQNFYNTNNQPPGLTGPINNVFAQQYLHDVWFNIFLPDSVLTIQNSMLNNLNISQVIIENCVAGTVRGSTNIPVKISCWENVPGQSLILNA